MNNNLINIMKDTSATIIPSSEEHNTAYPYRFFFAVSDKHQVKAIAGNVTPGITMVYELLYNHEKKEKLFLTAVDNLIKKNDFLQLTIQLDQELITDEEFQEELEKNEFKYLITMKDELDESDFRIATEILPKLNRTFTADEVSELFSMPIENINTYLDSDLIKENS